MQKAVSKLVRIILLPFAYGESARLAKLATDFSKRSGMVLHDKQKGYAPCIVADRIELLHVGQVFTKSIVEESVQLHHVWVRRKSSENFILSIEMLTDLSRWAKRNVLFY